LLSFDIMPYLLASCKGFFCADSIFFIMMTVYLSEALPNYISALKIIGVPLAERAEAADALLLPGGGDIHPKYYGQRICGARAINEARDMREFSLVRQFAATERPIFGICRGLQLLNICFGGTLRQHIDGHSQICGADRLHTAQNSDRLLALYGEYCAVNSAHHQAIDLLGKNLRAIQWANDGTIEAFRHSSLPIFAVQWHPERLCGAFARSDAADGLLLLRDFFLNEQKCKENA